MTTCTYYPARRILTNWLTETFSCVEQHAFQHWQGLADLTGVVDRVVEGNLPRFAALQALRDHNQRNFTDLTFEEVASRSCAYILADVGEWVLFVASDDEANRIVRARANGNIEQAITEVDPSFAAIWFPMDDSVLLLRSPYTANCAYSEEVGGAYDGLMRGHVPVPSLPGDVTAALYYDLSTEVEEAG